MSPTTTIKNLRLPTKPAFLLLSAGNKACATCGNKFFPRSALSKVCDFCKTPKGHLLAVPAYFNCLAA